MMLHIFTFAYNSNSRLLTIVFLLSIMWSVPYILSAATLSTTPDSGVYTVGETISVRVLLDTAGATINAADGRIKVSGSGVNLVGVSQAGSIFSLWAEEPRISGDEVVFSGGVPAGYSGRNGTVVTITLRTTAAGTPRLSFQDGSVLAADGRGSNVLSNMNGATYTVRAQESAPEPERVEYVPAANTPPAPKIESRTHPEQDGWSKVQQAKISWSLPSGVTQVRTAVTQSTNTVPNQVADSPIRELTTESLPDGVSYAHVQFRNSDGWGDIGRYRLGIDSQPPENLTVARVETIEAYRPEQELSISASSTAPLSEALIQIDGEDPISYELSGATSTITLPALEPGYRTIIVEVFDAAGNSAMTTLSLTIDSFAAPTLESIPDQFTAGTVPVFVGTTTPRADVVGLIRSVANDTKEEFHTVSDGQGTFQIIPDRPLRAGIYELTVRATDEYGARSELAGPVRYVVHEPGYVQIGSWLISVLSIMVPTIALVILLVLMIWYGFYRWRRLRSRVAHESREAHDILRETFSALQETLDRETTTVTKSRKSGQLTKAEEHLVHTLQAELSAAQERVEKEVADIEALVPAPQHDAPTTKKQNKGNGSRGS